MEPKKFFFETSLVWKEKIAGAIIGSGTDETIEVATHLEFPDGEEGKWCPESLFLAAISSCFMNTFLSLAKKNNLYFNKFRCYTAGEVEVIDRKAEFIRVEVFPEIHLMKEEQQLMAEEVLKLTEKQYFMGNAVKSKILIHHMISGRQELEVA